MTFDTSIIKKFIPPKRLLLFSSLKQGLIQPLILFIVGAITSKKDTIFLGVIMLFIIVVSITIYYSIPWLKAPEELEITISNKEICGLPEAPWFNNFEKLQKICIPLQEIDKQKTRIERVWYASAILIWSTDGRNIILSGAFDKEQLREIAGLIGCTVEL